MRRFINVANAVRDFYRTRPDAVTAVPSIGYKLQTANAGLVHTMTAEDVETLYQLAAHLRATLAPQ